MGIIGYGPYVKENHETLKVHVREGMAEATE
jgi:hypothetical protein